jgi:predicted PurR-regulated permease PerM
MELSRAPVLRRPQPENIPHDPPQRRGVPRSLVLASELGWRFLVVVGAIAVLAYGLWYIRLVALPAFLALLLSTILVPPARALRRRGLRPALATFIVFLGGLLVVAGVGALVVPAFASEVGKLSDTVTGGAQELGRLLAGPLGLSHDQVQSAIDSVSRKLHASGGDIASGVMSGAVIAGQIVAAALLTLVLLFFYVKDGASLWRWTVRLFPAGVRPRVDDAGRQSWLMLGAYVRGQALVATVDAVFIGIGLAIIGLPLVLPLAVLIFVGAFVPIVGAFVAGAAAVLIALVSKGAGAALVVLGINLAVQQLEGNVLYPMIMRKTIELHPVATLLIVGAGGVLAGIIGALVAVPIAAVVATVLPILRGHEPPPALDPAED